MLVKITKDLLMNAVQHAMKAAAVNSPIPILQGIHIRARVRIRYAGKMAPLVVVPDDSSMSALFLITPVRTYN